MASRQQQYLALGGFLLVTIVAGGMLVVQSEPVPPSERPNSSFHIPSFEVTDPKCPEEFGRNIDLRSNVSDTRTIHTVAQNLKVPDDGTTIDIAGKSRTNNNYSIHLENVPADGATQDCRAQVRYTMSIYVPNGRLDPYALSITRDNTTVFDVTNYEGAEIGVES